MADTGNKKEYRALETLTDELDRLSERLDLEGRYTDAGLVWEAVTAIIDLETAVKLLTPK
jgi:hypothetical protein